MQPIDYDDVSRTYDTMRAGYPEMIAHIMEKVGSETLTRVLDVACGTANNTAQLEAVTGAQITGLDLSFGMLSKACKKGCDLSFVQSPASILPFRDGVFNLVFMTEAIHHIREIPAMMNEMYRVLVERCKLCIVTQSHDQIEHRITSRFFPEGVDVDKACFPTIDELESMLYTKGFENIESNFYSFDPVPLGEDFLHRVENKGYSTLQKISDSSYREGLRALRQVLEEGTDLQVIEEYTFMWATKP